MHRERERGEREREREEEDEDEDEGGSPSPSLSWLSSLWLAFFRFFSPSPFGCRCVCVGSLTVKDYEFLYKITVIV